MVVAKPAQTGLRRETHANENRAYRRRARHGIRSATSGATTGGRPASRNGRERFLKAHFWEEYAAWHLGLTEGAAEETKIAVDERVVGLSAVCTGWG
jgi:hypothetical protein